MTRIVDKAPIVDFEVEQGSDWNKSFQILDTSGTPISLDDWDEILGQARRTQIEGDPVAFEFEIEIDKPAKRVYISLPAETTIPLEVGETVKEDASLFYYDFVRLRAGRPKRIQQGRVFVSRDITRPAP